MKHSSISTFRNAILGLCLSFLTLCLAGKSSADELFVYQFTKSAKETGYNQIFGVGRVIESTQTRGFLIYNKTTGQFRTVEYRSQRQGNERVKTYTQANISYDFVALFETGGERNFLTLSLYGTGNNGDNCQTNAFVGGFNDVTFVDTLAGRIRTQRFRDTGALPVIDFEADLPSVFKGEGVTERQNETVIGTARFYEKSRTSMRLKKRLSAELAANPNTTLKDAQFHVIDTFLAPRGYVDEQADD